MKGITVQEIADDKEYGLELEVISGFTGVSKKIYNPRIQKLGLVTAGYMVYLHPHRVQILGYTEISYLRELKPEEGERIVKELCSRDVACFMVTRNLKVPGYLLGETEERGIPLLRTRLVSSVFIERMTRFLEEKLAPTGLVHGVLMEIMGIGVLILGRSGIGKSENALDLVMRGHRLVTDDIIEAKKIGALELMGEAPLMLKNLLEIRGVGIVDIRQLFGVSAVRERTKIELVVELLDWDTSAEYERVGLREDKYRLLGIDLPLVRVPVSPGRNVSAIIELACRNHVLKKEGVDTARELEEKVLKATQEGWQVKVLILSGISGSGKTTFLKALEDAGYFCVDNFPLVLLHKFLGLYPPSDSRLAKSAFVIDIREREFFEKGKDVLKGIKKKYGAELIFLESSDETLFRRFKETRRTHPFLDVSNIKDALAEERQQVGWIKEISDKIIDTTLFTTHGLRNFVMNAYGTGEKRMKINLISFGFAYGIPLEADIVQDVRFLPNPFFVEGLRHKTGLSREVAEYMMADEGFNKFFPMLLDFLVNLIPLFEREGKSYLTICIGCTGGRHRSVYVAGELEGHLRIMDYNVSVMHRDVDKEER